MEVVVTIAEVLEILGNRVDTLTEQRLAAVTRGDLSAVTTIDGDLSETSATLAALQAL